MSHRNHNRPAASCAAFSALATLCALAALGASSCEDDGHAPHGAGTGGGLPGGTPTDSDVDSDADSDTDSDADSDIDADAGDDAGPEPCGEDEVEEPDADRCWRRCPLGQAWDGDLCLGPATTQTWEGAIAGCFLLGGGMHLASRQEVIELLGNCDEVVYEEQEGLCNPCFDSAACDSMFGFDVQTYWTSTDGEYAPWVVDFATGTLFMAETEFSIYQARCVRDFY